MMLTLLYDTHYYRWSRLIARLYLSNFSGNLFIGRLLWGDEFQMSSLHRRIFLSADNPKSRRCLEHTVKVVVAIYVVENKIGVFPHYI